MAQICGCDHGEYIGDYNELVYLRARYYAPSTGRFLTRDTWGGDYNRPLSLNRWMYVEGNPVNQIDPSGHQSISCERVDPYNNVSYIENNVNLSKSDVLNTYTAAGIMVQCWRLNGIWPHIKFGDYAARGPAQITNKWTSTPYGEWIENPDYPGDTTQNRGYGLRCYIPIAHLRLPKEVQIELAKSCAFCFTKDQIAGMPNFYQVLAQEPIYGQNDIDGATIYMKRMIQLIVNACKDRGCGDTDAYIAAALAQNGPGFTIYSMGKKELQELPPNQQTQHVKMNWIAWFEGGDPINNSEQLLRFTRAIQGLAGKNWTVPYIDWAMVFKLINTK